MVTKSYKGLSCLNIQQSNRRATDLSEGIYIFLKNKGIEVTTNLEFINKQIEIYIHTVDGPSETYMPVMDIKYNSNEKQLVKSIREEWFRLVWRVVREV